jgi:hypothetical protein
MKSFAPTADQLEGNSCGLDDWGSVPCDIEFIFFIYPEWIEKNLVLYPLRSKGKVRLNMQLL